MDNKELDNEINFLRSKLGRPTLEQEASQAQQIDPATGLMRLAKQIPNKAVQMGTGLISAVENVAMGGHARGAISPDFELFPVGKPQSTMDVVTDMGTEAVSYMVPALGARAAVARGAKALGAGERTASVLGSAAGWGGVGGVQDGAAMGALEAGMGASQEALEFLPRKARVLPSLALGLAGGALAAGVTDSPESGVVYGVANALGTLLPGQRKSRLSQIFDADEASPIPSTARTEPSPVENLVPERPRFEPFSTEGGKGVEVGARFRTKGGETIEVVRKDRTGLWTKSDAREGEELHHSFDGFNRITQSGEVERLPVINEIVPTGRRVNASARARQAKVGTVDNNPITGYETTDSRIARVGAEPSTEIVADTSAFLRGTVFKDNFGVSFEVVEPRGRGYLLRRSDGRQAVVPRDVIHEYISTGELETYTPPSELGEFTGGGRRATTQGTPANVTDDVISPPYSGRPRILDTPPKRIGVGQEYRYGNNDYYTVSKVSRGVVEVTNDAGETIPVPRSIFNLRSGELKYDPYNPPTVTSAPVPIRRGVVFQDSSGRKFRIAQSEGDTVVLEDLSTREFSHIPKPHLRGKGEIAPISQVETELNYGLTDEFRDFYASNPAKSAPFDDLDANLGSRETGIDVGNVQEVENILRSTNRIQADSKKKVDNIPTDVNKTASVESGEFATLQNTLRNMGWEADSETFQILSGYSPSAIKTLNEVMTDVTNRFKNFFNLEISGRGEGSSFNFSKDRISIALGDVMRFLDTVDTSDATRAIRERAMFRLSYELSHEMVHALQMGASRKGGVNEVANDLVRLMRSIPLRTRRKFVEATVEKAFGKDISDELIKYLSGDTKARVGSYSRASGLNRAQAAATEFFAHYNAMKIIDTTNPAFDLLRDVDLGKMEGFLDRISSMMDNVMHRLFTGSKTETGEATRQMDKLFNHWRDNYKGFRSLPSEKRDIELQLSGFSLFKAQDVRNETYRQVAEVLVGASVGGYVIPEITDGDLGVVEGMIAGGLGGIYGSKLIRTILAGRKAASKKGSTVETIKDLFQGKTSLRELGEEGTALNAPAMAKFTRWLEKEFKLNLVPEQQDAFLRSEGRAAVLVQLVDDAFKKIRASDVVSEDKRRRVMGVLNSRKLSESHKEKILLKTLNDSDGERNYANFLLTAHRSVIELQKMFASGLHKPEDVKKVMDSLGNWMTRQYRIFSDKNYKPTDEQLDKVANWMVNEKWEGVTSPDMARRVITDYVKEIEANRGVYAGSTSKIGAKLDQTLMMHRRNVPAVFREFLGEFSNPEEALIMSIRKLTPSAILSDYLSSITKIKDEKGFSVYVRGHAQLNAELLAIRGKMDAGIATPEEIAEFNRLKSFRRLGDNSKYGVLSGQYVDRRVFDQLSTFESPWGVMETPVGRAVLKTHNWIKIARTALNPLTSLRNIISAPVFMAIGRGEASTLKQSWEVLYGKSAKVGENEKTYHELLRHGIISADQVKGEFYQSYKDILYGNLDANIAMKTATKGLRAALEAYRAPDVLVRASVYLSAKNRLAKQMNLSVSDLKVELAARDFTNRYTMNYSDVSRMVKTSRQLPFVNLFISYTAEITRLTKNLAEDALRKNVDPETRVHAMKMLSGLLAIPFVLEKASVAALSEKDQEEWNRLRNLSPDYDRSRFKIVIGKDEEGNFRYLDFTSVNPADWLTQAFRAVGSADVDALLAANPVFGLENTPLLNVAAVNISGRDLHTGEEVDSLPLRIRSILKEVVPPIVPPGYEAERFRRAFALNEEGTRGTVNLKTGRWVNPEDIFLTYLTGSRVGNVSLSTVEKSLISKMKREMADEKTKMNRVLNTNTNAKAKEDAALRYERAILEIMGKYETLLDRD